jgi:hypothetical protein
MLGDRRFGLSLPQPPQFLDQIDSDDPSCRLHFLSGLARVLNVPTLVG